MTRVAAAALLLLAACGVAAASGQEAPPSAQPTAPLEALFADVWRLLSTESLFPRPVPGGAVSKALEQQHSAAAAPTAVPPAAAAAPHKPAPPERPAAQWVAVARTEADAWDLLRRVQAAEAGPAAAVAATLPARLAALEHNGAKAEAAAPALLPDHPKLTLSWWLVRNESNLDVLSRPLGNATFLSMGFSKTRLLRNLPDGHTQELYEWQFTFSVSTLGLACFALGLLCLALFPCLSREDEDCCDCDCECGNCSCECECGGCSCGLESDSSDEEAAVESTGCPEYIKAAGYTKL
ncbi:hypothetical protein C2E21_2642 [Chlorella sorokiniana]|uniref:Uncharacterized protein n=1 Tax=Chlorella sorokiniana TaxID=3076 RepID=A0A2P6TXV7_CHLSO|nr:hypothetical protein C2E21_2642 [Chlorella sorokiniana]|eukprot:PRW58904.1 hypothetical protein C2E21_2642 [Chlorella sorokiniana]